MREPSRQRGCNNKTNLGSDTGAAIEYVDSLAARFGKEYGIYDCPHCGGRHITTKLDKHAEYRDLVYRTCPREEG